MTLNGAQQPDGRARPQWRSLDELAGDPAFRAAVEREFPPAASEWGDGPSRRNFLKLMGASLALAGLTTAAGGCKPKTDEKIVSYVQQPEAVVPGRPLFFASAFTMGGLGRGVIVEQHEGRPTKIEGNPDHPASRGAADVFTQASLLSLYDPDRSQVVQREADVSGWGEFVKEIRAFFGPDRPAEAKRVRILTESISSPTAAAQIRGLLDVIPGARWHTFDPVSRANTHAAAGQAFGQDLSPIYDLTKADVVVSLDSNFLFDEPGSVRYARDFIDRRRVRQAGPAMANRLYVVESTPSITGATADHCLRAPPAEVAALAVRLHEMITGSHPRTRPIPAATPSDLVSVIAAELLAHRGRGLVIAGEYQPVEVHLLAHAMNAALGNLGQTVRLIPRVEQNPISPETSLEALAAAVKSGEVDLLVIAGANPAYASPADLGFADVLRDFSSAAEVGTDAPTTPPRFAIHLGPYADETARLCRWHIPESALPGDVERRQSIRRNGFNRAAADRPAVPGAVDSRVPLNPAPRGHRGRRRAGADHRAHASANIGTDERTVERCHDKCQLRAGARHLAPMACRPWRRRF